jgi:hypothetical protein
MTSSSTSASSFFDDGNYQPKYLWKYIETELNRSFSTHKDRYAVSDENIRLRKKPEHDHRRTFDKCVICCLTLGTPP